MNNTINNAFINGIFNNDHSRDIIAVSDDGREIGFTYDIFELLKTDKTIATIYDANTGEIIYTRDDLTTSTAASVAADAPVSTTYAAPARTAETIIDDIVELFKNNDELFAECIEELDAYNGYLGDDRFYSMDDLPDLLAGYDPIELLNRAYFGNDLDGGYIDADRQVYGSFNPNRDYYSFRLTRPSIIHESPFSPPHTIKVLSYASLIINNKKHSMTSLTLFRMSIF